jgi:hypothetical protein
VAVFWNDTFTESGANVGLTSHTPETGGSYSYLTAIDAGTSATVNATTDRCEFPTGTFTSGKPSASPGSADYTVSGNCRFNDSTGVLRVYVRVSSSNGYCGEARLDGTYNIYRVDSGSFTSIVSGSLSGLSGFTNYAYSFGITGSSLSMTFNGTTISVSNSTYTAAGAAAVGGRGVEVDNVSADDSVTASNLTGSITLDAIDPAGTLGLNPSTLGASTLTLDNIAPTGTLGIAPGSVTTFPFVRNTGSRPLGLTAVALAVLSDDANMTRLAGSTSLSLDANGRLTYTGAGLPSVGTSVLVVTRESDGKLGLERYTVA